MARSALETKERKVLVAAGTSARLARSGQLVFARNGAILAAPFDVESLELSGVPQVVTNGVVTSHAYGVGERFLVVHDDPATKPTVEKLKAKTGTN